MPYITEQHRKELEIRRPLRPGEITYEVYKLCKEYLGEHFRYDDIAIVVGCLETAKMELYRRVAAPYEDKKLAQNGDV
jgi:hypothetical protein